MLDVVVVVLFCGFKMSTEGGVVVDFGGTIPISIIGLASAIFTSRVPVNAEVNSAASRAAVAFFLLLPEVLGRNMSCCSCVCFFIQN